MNEKSEDKNNIESNIEQEQMKDDEKDTMLNRKDSNCEHNNQNSENRSKPPENDEEENLAGNEYKNPEYNEPKGKGVSQIECTAILFIIFLILIILIKIMVSFVYLSFYITKSNTCIENYLFQNIVPIFSIQIISFCFSVTTLVMGFFEKNGNVCLKKTKTILNSIECLLLLAVTIMIQIYFVKTKKDTYEGCGQLRNWTIAILVFYWIIAAIEFYKDIILVIANSVK